MMSKHYERTISHGTEPKPILRSLRNILLSSLSKYIPKLRTPKVMKNSITRMIVRRPGSKEITTKHTRQNYTLMEASTGNPAVAHRFDNHHFESKGFVLNVPKQVFGS